MEIKTIEKKSDLLRVEVHGADHALMNLLRGKLNEVAGVEFATYSTPHPLLEGFEVTVKGKDPEGALKKAIAAVKKEASDIKSAFKKA
jgi:DNA-directed RNA polymerase subunit L